MIRCLKCMKIFDEAFDVCPHCGEVVGSPPEIAFHLFPGTILNGRYIIGTTLGHGGFGITYNAWDQQLNSHIAIKEYYPNGLVNRIPGTSKVMLLSGEKEKQYYLGLSRFLDEARQTARFSDHPNIVHVYNFFEENSTAYIVMEFLDGISLKGLLKQWDGKLPIDQSIEICTAICDALIEIHKYKILHRDINPSNIFLSIDNAIKLIDFGSARVSDDEKEKTRSIIITPGYAPPEQYRTKSKQGPWTDIYAVCAVLYRCITGWRPIESLDRTIEDTLDNPKAYNPQVEDWLDKVIMRGMALDGVIRFKSAEELKSALENKRDVEYPEIKIKKRKQKRIIGFAAASLFVMGSIVGISLWNLNNRVESLADMEVGGEEIVIWVEKNDEKCYKNIIEKFEENYSDKNIKVKLESVSPDDYAKKLSEAIEKNEEPDIVFVEYLDSENYKELADLSIIYDSIDLSSYQLLPNYRNTKKADIMIPLGYQQMSMFINKSETLEDTNNVQLESFSIDVGTDVNYLNDRCVAWKGYETFLTDNLIDKTENIDYSISYLDLFVNQQINYTIAKSSDYKTVQSKCGESESVAETVAGNYYSVPILYKDKAYGTYDSMVGVLKSNDNIEKGAEFFISYLLSEQAQDIMHIQNEGGLPLQEAAFDRFIEYNNMISFVEDYYNKVKIID